MNIIFKIKQPILIAILLTLIVVISIFLYFQLNTEKLETKIEYGIDADILNPKFIKEKRNKDHLEVIAKKASFLTETEIFLEGNVKYASNNFVLESDKVNFDQENFNAFSDESTLFISEKVSIRSEGFKVEDKGTIILFKGKSHLIIEWKKIIIK